MARAERDTESPTEELCRGINLLCVVHCSKKCSKSLHFSWRERRF